MPTTPLGGGHSVPGDLYWTNRAGTPTGADPAPGPQNISDVMAASVLKDSDRPSVPTGRAKQLAEAAASYGAQAGMDRRARELNAAVAARGAEYDRVFNFSALLLEPGFLPPVIVEGRDAYNQPSPNEVRAADRLYRIVSPARLVSVPPTWRDYLPIVITGVESPDVSQLPKTREERAIWDRWASEGWKRGYLLADQTFEANKARLLRDYEGMIRFKALYEQGVVSKPVLARSVLGVTGGGDEMAIGDRIDRITHKSQLDPARDRWSRPMPMTAPNDPPPASYKP